MAEGFNWLARRQRIQEPVIVAPVQVGAGPSEYAMLVGRTSGGGAYKNY